MVDCQAGVLGSNPGGPKRFSPWNYFNFLIKFELDVDSFGSRRGVADSVVVSAVALVLNSPANLLFLLYQNSFFWPSAK